jgi:hypothetical protein
MGLNSNNHIIFENESKKRRPEKSAGRGRPMSVEAFLPAGIGRDFSRSFGYFSIMGKVTYIQWVRKSSINCYPV